MAISEFAFALCMLLGTLLIPFAVLCQIPRLKRRAIRITALAATPRGVRR